MKKKIQKDNEIVNLRLRRWICEPWISIGSEINERHIQLGFCVSEMDEEDDDDRFTAYPFG